MRAVGGSSLARGPHICRDATNWQKHVCSRRERGVRGGKGGGEREGGRAREREREEEGEGEKEGRRGGEKKGAGGCGCARAWVQPHVTNWQKQVCDQTRARLATRAFRALVYRIFWCMRLALRCF